MKRLVELLRQQCNLSKTEATACIEAFRQNRKFSSEAVNHYGKVSVNPVATCIFDAIEARHRFYKYCHGPKIYWSEKLGGSK